MKLNSGRSNISRSTTNKKGVLLLVVAMSCFFLSFTLFQRRHIRLFLVGDSTMADKQLQAYPETGWGMPFALFFDSTVTVSNRAKNGRSTSSFISENLWQPVVNNLKEGDFVLIQFGHNDEVASKAVYTTPNEFSSNLAKFITETRSKKAEPVLITPVARRKFDSSGHVESTHRVYSAIVRTVAKQYNTPLIDLDLQSQQLLQQLGPETSKLLFNYLDPGEHPNYPDGKQDDTHFSELGARKMAQIILQDIRDLHLELADRIVQRTNK